MRSLALLIAAAAGANAMIELHGALLPDNKYICATNCQEQGVFLGEKGTCFESEAVIQLDQNGQDVHSDSGMSFTCVKNNGPNGRPSWRERKTGETPSPCESKGYKNWPEPHDNCPKDESLGRPRPMFDIEEVKERLKADAAAPPPPPPPVTHRPEGWNQECRKKGAEAFQDCTKNDKNPSFGKCNMKGVEAIKECEANL